MIRLRILVGVIRVLWQQNAIFVGKLKGVTTNQEHVDHAALIEKRMKKQNIFFYKWSNTYHALVITLYL